MVSFGGFFEEMLVLDHLFFIWEGDTVDSLERIVLGITEPVGSRVLDVRRNPDGGKEPS
jgi:hypothetical protein